MTEEDDRRKDAGRPWDKPKKVVESFNSAFGSAFGKGKKAVEKPKKVVKG